MIEKTLSTVEAVAGESRALMARALEEAEEEMRCKAELIQQIRAMERVPVARSKLVDLTQTGGRGLLVEMSVAELRERLSLLRVAEAEEEERKRKEIAATKQVPLSLSIFPVVHSGSVCRPRRNSSQRQRRQFLAIVGRRARRH